MGYYTYFNLRVTETPHLFNGKSITNEFELEIAQKLYSIISDGDVLPKVPDYCTPLEYVFDDEMKWYDYEQDMKELSKQILTVFPPTTVTGTLCVRSITT